MPTKNHNRKLAFFNFRSTVKMIKAHVDPIEIMNFISRNNVSLEKNFFGKSILYYALDADFSLISKILEAKKDFDNEKLAIAKAIKKDQFDLIVDIVGNNTL